MEEERSKAEELKKEKERALKEKLIREKEELRKIQEREESRRENLNSTKTMDQSQVYAAYSILGIFYATFCF